MNNNYDFPVELQPIYLADGKEITKRKAVVRTDTMQSLGVVSNSYGLMKHASVIDSFREAGKAYDVQEKISVTNNGGNLFYQMTFPRVEMEVSKGDMVKMMLIAKNSYNGGSGLQVIFGAFRLVCENGLILGTQFMSFMYRHVGDVGGLNNGKMIDEYRDAYANYIQMFNDRLPVINEMNKRSVSALDYDVLFDAEQVRFPNYLLDAAEDNFFNSKEKTLWAYYNSLTYAVTHNMRKENPSQSIWLGMEAWRVAEKHLKA